MDETLLETVVSEGNFHVALKAVKRNGGAAGIDRMRTAQREPRSSMHRQGRTGWWI